jgi:hypothetical protein
MKNSIIFLTLLISFSCATDSEPIATSTNHEFIEEQSTEDSADEQLIKKLPPEEYAEQWDYFKMIIEDNLPFDWDSFVEINGMEGSEIEDSFRDMYAFDMIAQYDYIDLPYAHLDGEEVKEILIGAVDAEGTMHGYYYYLAERPNGLKLVGKASY